MYKIVWRRKVLKKSLLLGLLLATSCIYTTGAYAKNVGLEDLQALQNLQSKSYSADAKIYPITRKHWVYETLQDFTKKYGGKAVEDRPLTREEAAYLLVNLSGHIQENKIKISDADKALIGVMKKELSAEIQQLSERVGTLEGRVSNIEEADKQNLKFAYGKDFKITGDMQARYMGNTRQGPESPSSNFNIPLSELYVTGKINDKIGFTTNIMPTGLIYAQERNQKATVLADAFVDAAIGKHHTIQIGQTQVPIGQEATQWLLNTDTADKAQYARYYCDKYDLGAKVIGTWDFVDYYAGVYNGSGMNNDDQNNSVAGAGWINVRPFYKAKSEAIKGLELGGGLYRGDDNYVHNDISGAYIGYKYKKFSVKSEYSQLTGFSSLGMGAKSWYVSSKYDLTNKLAFVLRYDTFNTNDNHDFVYDNTEYTAGTNYKIAENFMVKLNLVHVRNKNWQDSQRVNLLTQFMF